jgi:ankyrin repeat protein
MAPSELSRSITNEQWDRVEQIANSQPKQASTWCRRTGFFEGRTVASVLPLHEAVFANAPIDCVKAIISAYPGAAHEFESSYQRLPLHCACRKNADPHVIALLIGAYSNACLAADSLGRLPLHYALSNGADPSVIKVLMDAHPEAARGLDQRGWTPLHVACSSSASVSVVCRILAAYPEAVFIRTKKGSSTVGCISKQCSHRQQLKSILNEAEAKLDSTISLPTLHHRPLPDMMLV